MTWLRSIITIFTYIPCPKQEMPFQMKIKDGYQTDLSNVNNQTNVCLEKTNIAMNFIKCPIYRFPLKMTLKYYLKMHFLLD